MDAVSPYIELTSIMPRLLWIYLMLLLISGCATPESCSERQFFKPSAIDGGAIPNRYFPGVAEFRLDEDVTLRTSVCEKEGAKRICIEIYPAENVSFQFSEPIVTVSHQINNTRVELPITQIRYDIACHGPTIQDAACQSSTASPLIGGGHIEQSRTRTDFIGSNFYYADSYVFPPESAFKGATVRSGFATFRRKYEATTKALPLTPGGEFRVSFSSVRIGSRSLTVPKVVFKFVNENVCLPSRQLSLQ